MIDVEILPEMALRCPSWELFLGMPIQQVVEIFKKHDLTITNVDFWYSEKLIEITDLSKITLRYWSKRFSSPNQPPNLPTIIRAFGSTKQLLPDERLGDYRLCYRGIAFHLVSPASAAAVSSSAAFSTDSTPPQARDPVDTLSSGLEEQLIVKRIYVFLGQNLEEAKLPTQLPSGCFHGNIFLEHLKLERSNARTDKLVFDLIYLDQSPNPTREPQMHRFSSSVSFGDTIQDVLSALGSPSRILYKTEDKMKIHLPQTFRQTWCQQRRSNFFYNYFTLGLDILFDASTNRAISFILHTNQPGEYTFNTYYRCMFELPLAAEKEGPAQPDISVTPFTKWSEVQALLGGAIDTKPVVLHREVRPGSTKRSPFGVTNAYGFQDLIFEVLPQNGYLTSVTIYSLPDMNPFLAAASS